MLILQIVPFVPHFLMSRRGKLLIGTDIKARKNQNSSAFVDNGGKEGSIDDSLLDEDDSLVSVSFIAPAQKSRSLEDKLDRFFSEFANLSQRIQNLEQKDSETAGSRTSSGRDSVHVARQPVAKSKLQPSSSASATSSGRLERRSAMVTRTEFKQQSTSGQFSDESSGFGSSRKRSYSQSSEELDPDLEQGEIRSKEKSRMLSALFHLQFSPVEIR